MKATARTFGNRGALLQLFFVVPRRGWGGCGFGRSFSGDRDQGPRPGTGEGKGLSQPQLAHSPAHTRTRIQRTVTHGQSSAWTGRSSQNSQTSPRALNHNHVDSLSLWEVRTFRTNSNEGGVRHAKAESSMHSAALAFFLVVVIFFFVVVV